MKSESLERRARKILLEPDGRQRLRDLYASRSLSDSERAQVDEWIGLDETLESAFKLDTAAQPDARQLARIVRESGGRHPTARLLRRIRRPVNTMLWLTVLTLSVAGLASLAWCVYWLLGQID